MSFIDVTSVLTDPMLAGQIVTVLRRSQTVNEAGEGIEIDTQVPNVVCAIYPTGDNSLVRQEAFSAQNQTITVCTIYRLRGQTKDNIGGWLPDLVIWDGNPYIVVSVKDFSRFGAGFIEAECEAFDWQQAPAQNIPAQVGRADFSQPAQSALVPLLTGNTPPVLDD